MRYAPRAITLAVALFVAAAALAADPLPADPRQPRMIEDVRLDSQ